MSLFRKKKIVELTDEQFEQFKKMMKSLKVNFAEAIEFASGDADEEDLEENPTGPNDEQKKAMGMVNYFAPILQMKNMDLFETSLMYWALENLILKGNEEAIGFFKILPPVFERYHNSIHK